MEAHSLERASQYLNNLLLARGLLTNGKPIDFAQPGRHGSSTDPTMSRVINLVHDLVLRRDQDAEQRENLAMHIRQARADESQRVVDLQRLQDKNNELARLASTAESQERTLKANMRKAEAQAKGLKEQMLKMKSILDQVRAKCLSDVRKRDGEMDKLKAHLVSMQRGKKESSGMKINTINWEPEMKGHERRNGQDVNSLDWSLEKESNDFLAALVNETSTENVSLRRIITDTMEILRDLTDLDAQVANVAEEEQGDDDDGDKGIGIPGQYRQSRRKAAQAQQQALSESENLTSCDYLAQQMTTILEHCQSILKDPSFVPIEEVQLRDEQIIKLQAGWEKMANRWKEAVTMMDNWRKRMSDGGQTLSHEDLSSLEFGKSVAMMPNGQPVFAEDDELSSILYESTKLEMDDDRSRTRGGSRAPEDEQEDVRYPALPPEDSSREHSEQQDSSLALSIPAAEEPSPKRRASIARKAGLNGKPLRPLRTLDINQSPGRIKAVSSPKSSRKSADSGLGSSDGAARTDVDADGVDDEEDVWLDDKMITKSRIPRQVSIINLCPFRNRKGSELIKTDMNTTDQTTRTRHDGNGKTCSCRG